MNSTQFVTSSGKATMVAPQLSLILLPQPKDTLSSYPFPVYQILNVVNWSAF